MKKLLFIVLLTSAICSCNTQEKKQEKAIKEFHIENMNHEMNTTLKLWDVRLDSALLSIEKMQRNHKMSDKVCVDSVLSTTLYFETLKLNDSVAYADKIKELEASLQ